MKRLFVIAFLTAVFAACGDNSSNNNNTSDSTGINSDNRVDTSLNNTTDSTGLQTDTSSRSSQP